jgi:hypothetical protein
MPAKPHRYYVVNQFPEMEVGQSVTSTYQGSLLPTLVDEAPQTVIKCVGIADHESYLKYQVVHETHQEVVGRYMNEPIHGYVRRTEFHLFRQPEQAFLFVDTNKRICREMVRRVQDSEIPMDLLSSEIDLSRLGTELKSAVSGGWFRKLRIADVSTMAAFGPVVGESSEWDRLDRMGELGTLQVHYEFEGKLYSVTITPDRSIVVLTTVTESEGLRLLESIQAILDGYVKS